MIRLVYKAGHVTDVFNLKYLKKLNFNETNAIMRTIFFGCSAQLELGQLKKPNQIDEQTYLEINKSAKTFVVSIIEKLNSRLLVGSSFLHKTTSLNPYTLSTLEKDAILLRFQHVVQQLSQNEIISCHVGDKSLI